MASLLVASLDEKNHGGSSDDGGVIAVGDANSVQPLGLSQGS